jgi:CHAT domain-containing protein/tetratricopeptide (TPR) repeat protein
VKLVLVLSLLAVGASAIAQKPADAVQLQQFEEAEKLRVEAKELARYYAVDKRNEALGKYESALSIYQKIGSRVEEAAVRVALGKLHEKMGANRRALEAYTSARSLWRSLGRKADESKTLRMLADLNREIGDYKEAKANLEAAISIDESLGDQDSLTVDFHTMGILYEDQGNVAAAIRFYNKSLEIDERSGNKASKATTLAQIGSVYGSRGDNDLAMKFLNEALALQKEVKDGEGQYTTLVKIAELAEGQGEYLRAMSFYLDSIKALGREATASELSESISNVARCLVAVGAFDEARKNYDLVLSSYRRTNDFEGVASTLTLMGDMYKSAGDLNRALPFYDESLAIRTTMADDSGQAAALYDIAGVYSKKGDIKRATELYEKALEIRRRTGEKGSESGVLNALGMMHSRIGDRAKAAEYYAHALRLETETGDKPGQAALLRNLASLDVKNGKAAAGLEKLERALQIYRETGNRRAEGRLINDIGVIESRSNNKLKAIEHYNTSLMLRRSVYDRAGEALTLSNLRSVWSQVGNRRLAIFYGKQSINRYQELRKAMSEADRETQQIFADSIESKYVQLADLLVADGRLPEAQAVLAMLKEEEVFDYVNRDAAETGKLTQRADLREDEKVALAKYEKLAGDVGRIGVEFGKLQALKNKLPDGQSLAAEDQKKFDELEKALSDANVVFQVFLRELADEFAKRPSVVEQINENAGLQGDLKSWGDGVVALYTIAGEERYRVILTTPETQIDGKSEIKSVDLNRKIVEFRAAIQNPQIDPRPLGKELYDIIVKPIEKQLEGAKAKTLLWSLDGALRYVPISALWDGKQYFGQKYENVVITLASRTRLSETPRADWRVLGLGVTEAKQVTEPSGTRVMSFAALPSVGTELKSIVRDEQATDETGVLMGKRLLDGEFTEQSLKDRLGRGYNAVHIASHFSFRPGDMTKSFLLLGDGKALTLDKVKTSPQLKFNGVELLTLSACQTAVSESDANGKEIESFGVIAQQNGAKAVMATLWPVADESTAMFMSEFYRRKKESASLTKSEAIRQVQAAMIRGELKRTGQSTGCRDGEFVEGPKVTKFKCDTNAPYSHPYFWSPFVLIGNWR